MSSKRGCGSLLRPTRSRGSNACALCVLSLLPCSPRVYARKPVSPVLAQQNDAGYILANKGKDRGMYSHNIATLFLAEVSGMLDPERDERVRKALSAAAGVILRAQNQKKKDPTHRGGWRYSPGDQESDLSASGWALMALRSARLNGARVPEENIQLAVEYVLGKQGGSGGFGYTNPPETGRISLTAAGILSLTLTGYHDSPEVARAGRYMHGNFTELKNENARLYALYYCTQAAFQLGGKTWGDVGAWVYERYLPLQEANGSWAKSIGGRGAERSTPAYRNAMVLLSLTVPYRQLPIYQRDETVDE